MTIFVILCSIRSLHNVGSIFRTADAAGVDKIYLCGITPTPLDRFGKLRQQMTKVSLGAEKTVAWETCFRTGDLIKKLKNEGFEIIALEQNKNSIPYYKFNNRKNKKVALVVGGEVKGLSKLILDKCDEIIEIPMNGKKESLNVAVAFGIAVFYIIHNVG